MEINDYLQNHLEPGLNSFLNLNHIQKQNKQKICYAKSHQFSRQNAHRFLRKVGQIFGGFRHILIILNKMLSVWLDITKKCKEKN